jgi:mannose-6-phosphate isomerase-like protein (cupin superfamily)
MRVANLSAKFAAINEHFKPGVVARVNDYEMRIAKLKGAFIWHKHEETDELFLIHKGRLRIELRDGAVELGAGDVFVVPRGVEHRPVAEEECEIIMIEPTGTRNTGNIGGDRTVDVVDV